MALTIKRGKSKSAARTRRHVRLRKKVAGTDCDLFHLLTKNADAPRKPRLYVSCGTMDFLYGQHMQFVPEAIEAGWDVTHYEEPGAAHEWSFWDQEIAKFIPWMLGE